MNNYNTKKINIEDIIVMLLMTDPVCLYRVVLSCDEELQAVQSPSFFDSITVIVVFMHPDILT